VVNIDDWFHNEIVTGVQKMYALSLNGAPPAETITLTTSVWVETLADANINWQQALDAQRIRHTFLKLSRESERWPTPKHFLQHLVKRPSQKNSHEAQYIQRAQQQSIQRANARLKLDNKS